MLTEWITKVFNKNTFHSKYWCNIFKIKLNSLFINSFTKVDSSYVFSSLNAILNF